MDTLVTVVIPAYNAESFLGEAIRSVLTQDHRNLQVVVVDDGSEDGTAAVAESFHDQRLELIRVPNGGVARARNTGLQKAIGSMIAFLDSDDYWIPDKLSRQINLMESTPGLVAVGCYMRYVSESGAILGLAGRDVGEDELAQLKHAQLMPFPLSSALFRTNAVRVARGFDETLPGHAEDLDLMARLARTGGFACIPAPLGAYRIHNNSVSAREADLQRKATRFVRARITSGNSMSWDEFSRDYRLSWRQRRGDQVQRWYRCAGVCAAEHQFGRAMGYALLALVSGPKYTVSRLARQSRAIR